MNHSHIFISGLVALSIISVSCDSESVTAPQSSTGTAKTPGSSFQIREQQIIADSFVQSPSLGYLLAGDELTYEPISGPALDIDNNPIYYIGHSGYQGELDDEISSSNYRHGISVVAENNIGGSYAYGALTEVILGHRVSPITHVYSKSGEHSFLLTAALTDPLEDFSQRIQSLIGSPSAIGVSFRQRLYLPGANANFSKNDLQSMVANINDEDDNEGDGGNVMLHPTQNVILDLDQARIEINHDITSNVSELLRGRQDGLYTVDIIDAPAVVFRRPTSAEIAEYNTGIRLITENHWLPVATGERYTLRSIQVGNFKANLTNTQVDPIE